MNMKIQGQIQTSSDVMALAAEPVPYPAADYPSEFGADSTLSEAVNRQCVQLGMRLKRTMSDIVDNLKKMDSLNDGESEEG